jgi:hypothetical protein
MLRHLNRSWRTTLTATSRRAVLGNTARLTTRSPLLRQPTSVAAPSSAARQSVLCGAQFARRRCYGDHATPLVSAYSRRHSNEFATSLRRLVKVLSERGNWWAAEAFVPSDDGALTPYVVVVVLFFVIIMIIQLLYAICDSTQTTI